MITIRRAEIADIPKIMRFLDEHWKPGNILATDREFFDWQYVEDDKVNVFIGIDEDSQRIYGTLGMILYNHTDHPDASGCMWKTIKSGNPMLGLDIMSCANQTLNIRFGDAPMISKKVIRLFEIQGKTSVKMNHFFFLNPSIERENYRIACVNDGWHNNSNEHDIDQKEYSLKMFSSVEEMRSVFPEDVLINHIHRKDYRYIKRRFFDHPVYDYQVWGIENNDSLTCAVMITREVEHDGAKACKIVDYYGDAVAFSHLGKAFRELIKEKEYEYIDVYSYGFPTGMYKQAGFSDIEDAPGVIIPNYFHPFVRENITLNMLKPGVDGMVMFRADGDQDRPG